MSTVSEEQAGVTRPFLRRSWWCLSTLALTASRRVSAYLPISRPAIAESRARDSCIMLLNGAVATSIETFHPDRKAEFGEKTYWYQDFSVHVPFLGRSLIYRLGAKQCRFCLRS